MAVRAADELKHRPADLLALLRHYRHNEKVIMPLPLFAFGHLT